MSPPASTTKRTEPTGSRRLNMPPPKSATPQHAAAVPWHRDRTDVPAGAACNLSLFLDDCNADNGCLRFVPGSHRLDDNAEVESAAVAHGYGVAWQTQLSGPA